MVDFLFFYEHINREIENISLVRYELERRGYSCEFAHFSGPGLHKFRKRKNRARVVATPWLRYNSNLYHYLRFARRPYKLVDLQWEQVYNKSDVDSGIINVCDESLKAYHVCWGENAKERLESFGAPAENLGVCGAIQQDFGRPIFSDYYRSRDDLAEKYGLDKDKKWLLFVSSFSYATFPEKALKQLADEYGDSVYEFAKLSKKSFEKMMVWIEELLNVCDCEFIYRPHPSEKGNGVLDEMCGKYSNFHIIRDCSVKQWAKVSDHVNLWFSTSNAEIVTLGIDYSIVRPIRIPDDLEVESMYGEEYITTVEEFIGVNRECDNSPERIASRRRQLKHFYDYSLDRAAYERVADFLEDVYKSEHIAQYSVPLRERLRYWIKEVRLRIFSFVTEHQLMNPERELLLTRLVGGERRKNVHRRIEGHKLATEISGRVLRYMRDHE